ncbi:MAG: YerC/YecD family TrpR-related protein [Clostridiales bacterium]|nr:YerC/YecD family TrpR-related protein [Clostridiales bacterium]
MARRVRKEHVMEMYEAILKLESVEECVSFFEDLCSPTEISAMEQRYAVADLLLKNTVYLDILEKTKASTATISRVNRMVNSGTGCLPQVIERVNRENQAELL